MIESPSLVDLASRYWQSLALNAAVKLEVFPEIAKGPVSAEVLADTLDASPLHLESLLHALTGLGLLSWGEEGLELAEAHKAFLDPASPDCMLGALAFNADLAGLWLHLADSVKNGSPAMPGNPHLGQDPARTRRFVEGMHSRAGIMARGLLPLLHPPAGASVLDVGGGPGTFSLKLAERDPSLNITVLDLPPVVEAAQAIHAGHPALGNTVTFMGGNYHETELPGLQDWILYCGALHQEPETDALPLFQRLFEALAPGGTLAVVDLMLDADRHTPVDSALFELNMLLMRPTARVHSSVRVEELLKQVGFTATRMRDVDGTPYRLVEARR